MDFKEYEMGGGISWSFGDNCGTEVQRFGGCLTGWVTPWCACWDGNVDGQARAKSRYDFVNRNVNSQYSIFTS